MHLECGGLFAPTSLEELIDAEAAIVSSMTATLFSSVFGCFAGPVIKYGSLSVGSGHVVSVGPSPSASFFGVHLQACKVGSGSRFSGDLLGLTVLGDRIRFPRPMMSESVGFQANVEILSEDEGCEVNWIDC